jgi:hypothetical protein
MKRAEMNQDPVQGEFFTPEGLADSLVREIVQNSLDASCGRSAVKIRFAFSNKPLAASDAKRYLAGLEAHLAAATGQTSVLDEPMRHIVIEDFGTRGLRGDPRQADDEGLAGAAAEKNDFFYFWRNIGRSSKSDTDRGRWGLGKTVLPASSKINSFFGLTVREEDGKALLMGQTVLKVHKVKRDRFPPYGYYSRIDDDDFSMPLGDARAIRRFRNDFGLTRDREPGLSLVIPYPKRDELAPPELARAAIVHYFYPILAGSLVIEIVDGDDVHLVSRETIDDLARRMDWSQTDTSAASLKKQFELARWSIALPVAQHIALVPPPDDEAPEWNESLFAGDDLRLIRTRYDAGDRIALRVPVKIHRLDHAPAMSWFGVYLERDDTLNRGEDHYIRQGITISDLRLVRDRGVRGLVVVEDAGLSSMLGDSENPAHTKWEVRAGKLKERYVHGSKCVNFVRVALRQLVELLQRRPQGLDRDLLSELFSITRPDDAPEPGGGGVSGPGKKRPGPETEPEPPDPPGARPAPFRVSPIEGGFRIAGRGGAETAIARLVEVRAAYEVRKGNPFKKYDPCDFRVEKDPISIRVDGATIEDKELNRIAFRVDRDDFEVKVTGFDQLRDLRVRTNLVKETEE